MRRCRGDLGIAPGRIEPFLGKRRMVVEVDQIVSDARMSRLTLEDRLQQHNACELVRIGLIVGRSCNIEHNRVADLSLIIVRITLSQGFHRLQVRLYPLAMWDSLMIRVESEQSVDIVTLALRLSA